MSHDPYMPPGTKVDDVTPTVELPEMITKKIKNCWVAGLISIAITLVLIAISIFSTSIVRLNAWSLIDVVIMGALTFGVYRGSRACAVLLFAFFALNKILMWSATGSIPGSPLSLVFFWFFGQGIVGTFQRHRVITYSAIA